MKREISVSTSGSIELKDITRQVTEVVQKSGIEEGICVVYCPHTTAAVTINESADPDVASDLERAFEAVVPDVHFDHAEGNSHSHLLSSLVGPSIQLLVDNSQVQLGRWQGVFFCEFDGPRQRRLWITVVSG